MLVLASSQRIKVLFRGHEKQNNQKLLWIFKDVYKLSVKLHELGTYAHSYLQQFCAHIKNSYVYRFL